ncbi:hypothetical protein [Pantoea sp. MQR6]|uniref:hypothetical protein n=1 Tax=Pantoea sp. MQR6 TaxID=2907307 RepID=UPI001FA9DDCA|nr:hypothetical protein [Pantoea sp. MQR6]
MKNERESNVGRMRDLVEFGSIYSSMAQLMVLKMSFKDTLAEHVLTEEEFPDVSMSISLDMAKKLITEMQRNVDAIEAGLNHPSLKFMD